MKNLSLRIFIIASLVLFGSLYYYSGEVEDHYQDNAQRYLEQTLTDIASWQPAALKAHLAEETLQQVSDDQLRNLADQYRHLGAFQDMAPAQLSRLSAALSLFSDKPRLSYTSRVRFAAGSATMTATLTLEDQHFKFYNLNLGEAEKSAQ